MGDVRTRGSASLPRRPETGDGIWEGRYQGGPRFCAAEGCGRAEARPSPGRPETGDALLLGSSSCFKAA